MDIDTGYLKFSGLRHQDFWHTSICPSVHAPLKFVDRKVGV